MQRADKYYYLPFLILLITFISVNQWSKYPIGNTFACWLIYISAVISMIKIASKYCDKSCVVNYAVVLIYFSWFAFEFIKGCFVADGYWEWKQLVSDTICLLTPLALFAFYEPRVLQKTLKLWFVWALLAYVVFFYWVVGITQFYMGPVYLIGCFIPLLPNKWKIIVGFLILLLLSENYVENRSQFIKAFVAIVVSLACIFHRYIYGFVLKTIHWALYVIPVVLLVSGITGTYNIFEETSAKYEGRYVVKSMDEDQAGDVDMSADTRTVIYTEVISSAIFNKYVWLGRTPARGNDSAFYGEANAKLNGKYERPGNELCFPNVFTWLGIVGMILYILIYLKASYMAVYHSRNIYIRLLGLCVAFHFLYGWVEDVTDFNILNLSLWMMIAMCYSDRFRLMTDVDFRSWVKGVFVNY